MKTLLTIILAFAFTGMFGQNDTIICQAGDSTWIINMNSKSNYWYVTTGTLIRVNPIEGDLFELLEEYSAECYNDSTLQDVYVDPNYTIKTSDGRGYRTAMGGYYEKRWVHKHPTFTGFIEWLRKRQED